MAASPTTSGPDPSTAVTRIALQVGATAVAQVDIGTMLTGVCAALPPAVGVAAAALLLTEPADPRDPQARCVFGSDDAASRLGLIQHRAGRGPVPAAIRGDRPLTVPDLTVSGPPELAAAAADCGLVRSLVVPVSVSGQPIGGLQLLAGADTALDERMAAALWPLVAALSARLADAREFARVAARAAEPPAEPVDEPLDEEPAGFPETTAVAIVDQDSLDEPQEPVHELTARLPSVTPESRPAGDGVAAGDLFATGETTDDTPPSGQAGLGWEGPEHTPLPTIVPTRALPARVPVVGRKPRPVPRPVPASVPAQRSGPVPVVPGPAPVAAVPGPPALEPGFDDGDLDGPTWRVPRHRLRDDG